VVSCQDFQLWRARDLDVDLVSDHTVYRRASLIDLYLQAKFHWNRRNFSWMDGHLRPTLLGWIRRVDLKWHTAQSKITLSLWMPARVMSWQSYSSIRRRLWQPDRCVSDASVMSGQLSSSKTVSDSAAHSPPPSWLMPSSVISSQCDNDCSNSHSSTAEHHSHKYDNNKHKQGKMHFNFVQYGWLGD